MHIILVIYLIFVMYIIYDTYIYIYIIIILYIYIIFYIVSIYLFVYVFGMNSCTYAVGISVVGSIFTLIFIRTVGCTYIHACMHACMHAYIRTNTHRHTHANMHTCINYALHAYVFWPPMTTLLVVNFPMFVFLPRPRYVRRSRWERHKTNWCFALLQRSASVAGPDLEWSLACWVGSSIGVPNEHGS